MSGQNYLPCQYKEAGLGVCPSACQGGGSYFSRVNLNFWEKFKIFRSGLYVNCEFTPSVLLQNMNK